MVDRECGENFKTSTACPETESPCVMPRGASPKREREYEELRERFKEEGRYKGREKEVASRIVNKQRAEYGETKEQKQKDREGKSPDRGLPVENYQHQTIGEISGKLHSLSHEQLEQIRDYEEHHKKRKTLIEELDRCLAEK